MERASKTWNKLIEEHDGTNDFRWTPVKRSLHTQEATARERPLGIPNWEDRVVQMVLKMVLESYYEPQFRDSQSWLPPGKRGCHTALLDIKKKWTGVKWFIEGDIEGCFDNIPHDVILKVNRQTNQRQPATQPHQAHAETPATWIDETVSRYLQWNTAGRHRQPI
jgi:retron-type reverse transcriptase